MATERTAAEIAARFQEEQNYMLRSVESLRSRLEVSSSDVGFQVNEMAQKLRRYRLGLGVKVP